MSRAFDAVSSAYGTKMLDPRCQEGVGPSSPSKARCWILCVAWIRLRSMAFSLRCARSAHVGDASMPPQERPDRRAPEASVRCGGGVFFGDGDEGDGLLGFAEGAIMRV